MLTRLANWWRNCRAISPNDKTFPLNDRQAWAEFLDGNSGSDAGEPVTKRSALSLSPVWQAVKMISGDCAKLPCGVIRRIDQSARAPDPTHPASKLLYLRSKANPNLTTFKVLRRWYAEALLWENSFLWVDRAGSRPVGLYNLLPDRTRPYFDDVGRKWWITEVDGSLEVLFDADVIHLEGLNVGDEVACDLVEAARHDFGLALATRKFTSKFFANGAHAGGILQVPPGVDKPVRDKVERSIAEQHTNTNKAFKTLVLRDGFRWTSTSVDPDKAQLIDLDEAKVRDVARWFNLKPSRLGVKESISYNSEESAKQDYYDSTLSYWLLAAAAEFTDKLLTTAEVDGRETFIEHNVNALLWADSKTRSEIANAGILSGRFTIDETRAWENLNPHAGGFGATPLRPVNTTPANSQPTPQQPDPARAAHRELLANAIHRVLKRIANQAERVAADDAKFDSWRSSFVATNRDAARAMLSDAVDCCHAVGLAKDRTTDGLLRSIFEYVDTDLNVTRRNTAEQWDTYTLTAARELCQL